MTRLTTKIAAARRAMSAVTQRGKQVDDAVAVCQRLLDPPPSYSKADATIDHMKLAAPCLDVGIRAGDPRSTMLLLAMKATASSPAVALFQGARALVFGQGQNR